MIYAMWMLAGWCGTPYPGWWRGPRPPQPPDPWFGIKTASVIGGVVGGWLTQTIIGADPGAVGVLTTLVGAFVGGGFAGGVVALIGGRGNVAAGA